jgi:hypothetical protein
MLRVEENPESRDRERWTYPLFAVGKNAPTMRSMDKDMSTQSILQTCQPRCDILHGSFNPEIFTASLSQVVDAYRGRANAIHTLYTDAQQFFRDATYPTEGLRMALTDVLSRLAGDHPAPTIHRLETAFGGGKIHTLIALTHVGFRGRELAPVTDGIVDPQLLPAPGEVIVVGVAGDEIPVHKPQGTDISTSSMTSRPLNISPIGPINRYWPWSSCARTSSMSRHV